MAQTYKILAQVTPSSNTLTNVYVTGASTQTVIGTITVSGLFDNPASNGSYSLIVRPINEALGNKHFIARGVPAFAKEVTVISGAVTMGPNTILAANSSTGNISFTAFGVELT